VQLSKLVLPPASSIAILQAYPVVKNIDGAVCYVKGSGLFAFHADSEDAANGSTVYTTTGVGRWVLVDNAPIDESDPWASPSVIPSGTAVTIAADKEIVRYDLVIDEGGDITLSDGSLMYILDDSDGTYLAAKRDNANSFTSSNAVLSNGQIAIETDTSLMKVGDGITTWASLPYIAGSTYSPSATLTIAHVDKSADYTVTVNDSIIVARSALTLGLPSVTTCVGQSFTIISATTGNVVIDPNGSEQIYYNTTLTLNAKGTAVKIWNDGTEWFII